MRAKAHTAAGDEPIRELDYLVESIKIELALEGIPKISASLELSTIPDGHKRIGEAEMMHREIGSHCLLESRRV